MRDEINQVCKQKREENNTIKTIDFVNVVVNQSVLLLPFYYFPEEYHFLGNIVDQQFFNEILKHHRRHPSQNHEKDNSSNWIQLTDPDSSFPNERNLVAINWLVAKNQCAAEILNDDTCSFLNK